MIPGSKFKEEKNFLSTKSRVPSKFDRAEQLINNHLADIGKSKRVESFFITKKERPTPIIEKKESILAFTARFNKKLFCTLSAKEIEAIMNENRMKIEQQH